MVGEGWSEVSEDGKAFLKQLLQVDPKRRLTAQDALSHPWIMHDGPSLDRRLSSITGLAAIASKSKKVEYANNDAKRIEIEAHSQGPTNKDQHQVDDFDGEVTKIA